MSADPTPPTSNPDMVRGVITFKQVLCVSDAFNSKSYFHHAYFYRVGKHASFPADTDQHGRPIRSDWIKFRILNIYIIHYDVHMIILDSSTMLTTCAGLCYVWAFNRNITTDRLTTQQEHEIL